MPFGPPVGLYVGRMSDPVPMLFLVATDANDGLGVIAINLAQTVDEYVTSKFTLAPPAVYPGVQIHWLMLVLPSANVMVLATQSEQVALPVAVLYVWSAHGVHAIPLGPVYPAMHVQSVSSSFTDPSLGTGELVFAGQKLHAVCPTVLEYRPATHGVHGPPGGPKYPILHWQLVICVDPRPDCEFVGHAIQSVTSSAPDQSMYLSIGHCVHASFWIVFLYFPTEQKTHWYALASATSVVMTNHTRYSRIMHTGDASFILKNADFAFF